MRERRAMVYCVVPQDLAAKLHEPLRRHFLAEAAVEVVVECRSRDRRTGGERRSGDDDSSIVREADRRRIRGAAGRRVGEERAPLVPISAPSALPRRARPYAERLAFVERIEPSAEHRLDRDTSRLVTRFQAGERDAFSEIYMRYFDRVYSYLRVLFREDRHEAEDLTQQVFARALEALPRYERRSQPFRAWLFTIARNQALTQLERRSRSYVVEPAEMARRNAAAYEDDPQIEALDWLTDRELVLFVERLPVAQRQVLVLRYMLDLPTSEISRILDLTADHVRTLEHRALRFLQERLRAIGRDPQRPLERRSLNTRGRVKWLPVVRQRRYALH